MIRSNGMHLRVGMFLAFLLVLLCHALPASAQSCIFYTEAPSGGASPTSSITAKGKVLCSGGPVNWSSNYYSVYLYKSGTEGAVASVPVKYLECFYTATCYTETTVSTPCVPGSYSVTTVPTGFGAINRNETDATSAWIPIYCGPPPQPPPVPTVTDQLSLLVGNYADFVFGYSTYLSIGALSPNTTGTGKTYKQIQVAYDYWNGGEYTDVTVCGFTSNPGPEWLTSVSAGGSTKMRSDANTNLYWTSGPNAGCAYWSWYGAIGVTVPGQQVQVDVVHQQ